MCDATTRHLHGLECSTQQVIMPAHQRRQESIPGYREEQMAHITNFLAQVRWALLPLPERKELLLKGEENVALPQAGYLARDAERTASPEERLLAQELSNWIAVATEHAQHLRNWKACQEREHAQAIFISAIGHEFKNAATGIKLIAQRLGKWGEQRDEVHVAHWCEQLDRQIMRIASIVNDMLDLSRIQVDKFRLCKQPFLLDKLVEEVVEDFQGLAPTHRLLVESQQNILVNADKERIGQVLINLLTNAIKYSPQAEVVRLSVTREQGRAVVQVQDSGLGIASAHHQSIFECFYQVGETLENSRMGLGLGLYLARKFIELHQGKIWVESEVGEGATFVFCLPLYQKTSDAGGCYAEQNDSHCRG